METDNENKLSVEPYSPSRDKVLFRWIAGFIATISALGIVAAVWLALCDEQDIAMVVIGIGSGGFGAMITFFTQTVPR